MRKYISLFIIFCLCFALISCNEARPSDTVTEAPTEKETEKSTLYVYDWEEVEQPSDVEFPFELDSQGKFIVPMGETRIDDLWTYQEFLRTAILPKDFISAEKLMTLGEFKEFIIINDKSDDYCQRYEYHLVYCGNPITVFVDHAGELPFDQARTLVPEENPPPKRITSGYPPIEITDTEPKGISYMNFVSNSYVWPERLWVDSERAYLYTISLDFVGVKINGTAIYISYDSWMSMNGHNEFRTAVLYSPESLLTFVGEWDGEW